MAEWAAVRIHDGEPTKIDVSILAFANDPNSSLELVAFRGIAQHLFVSERDVSMDCLQAHEPD